MSLFSARPSDIARQLRRGGLARSMWYTLFFFAAIPLTVMTLAALLISRFVLQDEVVGQMQSLVTAQIGEAQLELRVKQIRLDRIVRRPSFESATQILLHQSRGGTFFILSKNSIESMFAEINREADSPVFNQYLIFDEQGEILIASKDEWEGQSLSNLAIFEALKEADGESLAVFDFGALYPGQLVFLTLEKYRTSDNVPHATIIGITEPQAVVAILNSLTDLAPDSNAYFVTNDDWYITIDQHTGEQARMVSSTDQAGKLNAIFSPMDVGSAALAPATAKFTNSDGVRMLAQAVWVPELSAGVVLEVPSNTIFGGLNSLIALMLAIYFFTVILVTWVTNFTTRRAAWCNPSNRCLPLQTVLLRVIGMSVRGCRARMKSASWQLPLIRWQTSLAAYIPRCANRCRSVPARSARRRKWRRELQLHLISTNC